MKPADPVTPAEWQEAVDAARFFLLLDSSQQYGLVEGGPTVDVGRCEWVIEQAAKRGISPTTDEKLVARFLR